MIGHAASHADVEDRDLRADHSGQVPLYQRQDAWDSPQLSQLWEDVLEQYDLLTPDEHGLLATGAPTHFLGSSVDPGASSQRAGGIGRACVFFRAQLTQPGPDNEALDLVRIETVLRLLLDLVDGPHKRGPCLRALGADRPRRDAPFPAGTTV